MTRFARRFCAWFLRKTNQNRKENIEVIRSNLGVMILVDDSFGFRHCWVMPIGEVAGLCDELRAAAYAHAEGFDLSPENQ